MYFTGITTNVPPGSPVPFNTEGVCTEGDFVHTPGVFTSIEVVNEGDYLVNYSVIFNNTPQTQDVLGAFALYLNGVRVDASRFGTQVRLQNIPAAANTRLQVTGEAILSIPAGGILELRNISGQTVHVFDNIAGAPVNGSALTIVQIGNDEI
ncbi:hypothetical protein JCM9140_2025 [Halalkalibacter wakoensis JCM 9140]|uniref:BclA C-terminal domain-containing protein n=1 Tax=Halalkalibacter wakoensis JCM 9140 TaxID=1236970 RepID=W4Q200_9BACI|nr:hypothetical protein JCM9140_2025 [Halalkalibacter wakoensis JCM 9140]